MENEMIPEKWNINLKNLS